MKQTFVWNIEIHTKRKMTGKKEKQKRLCFKSISPSNVILSVCRANKFFCGVQTNAKKVRSTQLNAKKVAKQKKWCVQFKIRSKQKKKSYPENESFLGPFRNTCTRCFPRVPSNNIHRKFCINFFTERTTVDTKWKIWAVQNSVKLLQSAD